MLKNLGLDKLSVIKGLDSPLGQYEDGASNRQSRLRDESFSFDSIQSDVLLETRPTQFVSAERSVFEDENPFASFKSQPFPITDYYSVTLEEVVEQGIYPRIVINDTIGPAGSQNFASPFNAVVALALGCTGTLIAPDVVISARHCGASSGDQIFFGTDSGSPAFTATVSIVILPAGDGTLLDGGDVSIVFLAENVPADVAEPMRLSEATDALVGQAAVTVGYGFNGIGSQGHGFSADGLRWGGTNIIDVYGTPAATTGTNIFSTDFDDGTTASNTITGSDPNPLKFEATTAPGDSGGPLLVNQDGEWLISGVLSGGTSPTSVYGDISWWTGVLPFRNEIENAGGEFGPTAPSGDDHSDRTDNSATGLTFDEIPIARGNGVIGTDDDIDVFSFELLHASRVIADAVAVGDFDPFLRLYDSDGQLIADNNDKPGSLSSRITMELDAGSYFASVGSNESASTGRYRIAVRNNGPRDDFGDKFSNASPFMLMADGNTRIEGAVDKEDDIDMLKFIADRSGDLVIRTKALSGELNTVLRIYDSNHERIAANNNWNNSKDSRVIFNINHGSTYFVQLASVGATAGDYRILAIPKTESGDPGRVANVDLDMQKTSSTVEDLLEQQILESDVRSNMVSAHDPNTLTHFGPQPLGLIANGTG